MTEPLTFARWRTLYQPNRWKIEATGPDGASVQFVAPEDRDIAAAFDSLRDVHTMPAGTWTLQPLLSVKGKGAQVERQRLGLDAFQRPEALVLQVGADDDAGAGVDDDDAGELAEPSARVPDDVARAEAEARRERAHAIAAEARARRAQHEADAAEAQAKARQFSHQLPPAPQLSTGDLVAALRAMQEASDARLAQLLQQLRPAAPPPDPLQQLTQQLGLLRAVREEFDRATPPPPPPVAVDGDNVGSVVLAVARELRPVLQEVVARWRPAAAPAPAPAVRSPQLPPADGQAPAAAAAPNALAAERVRQFCAALGAEMQADAEPEAVADRVADLVGLLPSDVRAPIDAGDVPALIAAAAVYLPAEEAEQLRAVPAIPGVGAWLERLLSALRPEPSEEL